MTRNNGDNNDKLLCQIKEQYWLNRISIDKGADGSTVSLLGQGADGLTGLGQWGADSSTTQLIELN
jgi:hypothetical protein